MQPTSVHLEKAATPAGAGRRASPNRWFAAAALAVLALAALTRTVRWRDVLWGREVVALDTDSLYHMRRALDVAAGRGLPTFDPSINWPYGGPVPWAAGFDLLGGAVAWLAGPPDSRTSALAVAAIPVVLGLVVVTLAMALAWVAAPLKLRTGAAVASGLITSLVPQAIYSSRFGQTDHHVVEALLATGLAIWTVQGVDGPRRRGLFELVGALIAFGGVIFFTGAPLYVAIAVVPLVIIAFADARSSPLVGRGALGLLGGAAIAALATAPMVGSHGRAISFAFPSYLQPALVAIGGAGIAVAWALGRARSSSRLAVSAGVTTGVIVLVAVFLPAFRDQVVKGITGWLFARDPWIATIDEFQPAWRAAGGVPRLRALWGAAGFSLPVLAGVASWACVREQPRRTLALVFQAAAFAALAALQIRFGRPATPVLAAPAGIALAALSARAPVRPAVAALLAPALVLVAFAADPATWAATARRPLERRDAVLAAALDLRDVHPGKTAAGVLAPWDMGHEVNVVSRRPVVANGFGTYLDAEGFAEVQRAWTSKEAELVAWMERRRLGFVVAGLITFQGKVPGPGTGSPLTTYNGEGALDVPYMLGVPLAATILGGSGVPDARIPHLTRLLPRFASLPIARELPFPVPVLWTFEVVPGARLRGCASPRNRVVLEYELVERGRRHTWRAWTFADSEGDWELTVPLPTGYVQPTLATGPVARVMAGKRSSAPVVVPESAVRTGSVIDLCASSEVRATAGGFP